MIFADAFFMGLLLINDVNNPRASELVNLIDGNWIINNAVLCQINFLSSKEIKPGHDIKDSIDILYDIHYITANDYFGAIETYLYN